MTDVIQQGPQFELLATNSLFPKPEEKTATEQKTEQSHAPIQTKKQESPTRRSGQYGMLGPTVYGTAVVDQTILIRTGTQLFCISK